MNAKGVTAVLLLSCPDQKGLVAAVSDFLYRNDGNIIHADQHTDAEEGIFLQRVEWELEGFGIARAEIAGAFRPIAERLGMTRSLHFSDYVPRIAVFASRQPHCMVHLRAPRPPRLPPAPPAEGALLAAPRLGWAAIGPLVPVPGPAVPRHHHRYRE